MTPRRRSPALALTWALAGLVLLSAGCGRARDHASSRRPAESATAGAPRSPGGAVDAASAYLSRLVDLFGLAGPARRTALAEIADPAARERLSTEALGALGTLDARVAAARAAGGGRSLVRGVPLGYRLEAFSPERATVRVWTLGLVVIDGGGGPVPEWESDTIELSWVGRRWRVWAWQASPGPIPGTSSATPWPTAEFLAAVSDLFPYRYAR